MRIVFLSYGTRGDVQPQLAMASALRERGFETRVAAPENLRGLVERAGVEYAPLFGNSQAILESEAGQRWLRSGDVRAFMKEFRTISRRIDADLFRSGLAAVLDADAIVGGTLAEDMSFALAQYRKVPLTFGHTIPTEVTSAYAHPVVTHRRLPFGFLNRASYSLFRMLASDVHKETLATFRRELGLAPMRSTAVSRAHELGVPVLQLWSAHLLPHATDASEKAVTTGFLRMPQPLRARLGEAAPPDLVTWLDAGAPPVYVGFGSMPMPAPAGFIDDLLAIGRALGVRIALAGGWNDVQPFRHLQGEALHFIGAVDHGWLFSRCAAVVHHGGAGTTAAVVEAGVPQVVCSFFADQPFWGARIARAGVGAHLSIKRMTRATLTDALRGVMNDGMRQRATELGMKLRSEDGNARATEALLARLGTSVLSGPNRSGLVAHAMRASTT